jgi:hypothetical protein
MKPRFLASLTLLFSLISNLAPGSASAAFQAREHLTPEEIELIKDAQILDKRIEVFIKAADRRMLVLTGTPVPTSKQSKKESKDSEAWGALPTGTRAELIGDIAGIFEEATINIDDVNARDEKNPLIPKALRNLSAAASRIVEQLKPAESQATNEAELSSLNQLAENADEILQAANKLPPPVEKKVKSKSDKQKTTN